MKHFSHLTIHRDGREVVLQLVCTTDDDGIATDLVATVEGQSYEVTAEQREWFLDTVTRQCVEGRDEPRELDYCSCCHRPVCACDEIYDRSVDK